MRLNLRNRVIITLVTMFVVGYVYLTFCLHAGRDLVAWLLDKAPACDGSWPSRFNGCTVYHAGLGVVELLLATAIAVAVVVVATRWCLRPLEDMSAVVTGFGPANLGARINATGSNDVARRLAGRIDQMLDRLGEAYQSQSRFAANASHELRTPLATQRTLIEVSMTGELSEDQLALLSRQLITTNERSERLIEGLLTLAASDEGVTSTGPIPLHQVVVRVIETSGDRLQGLDIRTALTPCVIRGELSLVERLVSNLIDNAAKYNRDGGWIEVRVDPPGTLTVVNSGRGVPQDAVYRLFEPFQRLDTTRLAQASGVGLGLSIVRSIAGAHNAHLSADANADGGLTVRVRFPA